ncbi:ATP-binding protein [Natronincola ferrireducens]|uniref:Twitching motility protein PilT n=1 Tax=Natronincola ferrireducens TaxID=393762 RepID=A0A1G8Z103_9FIRM|nr:ATP-binding protein [Natronincola ferrireducens]SDK08324.1 hypothetical protein SAMN05660472_00694 [Natronincola ferrireducens]
MIKLIVGKKGSGKTKTLIHDANEAVKKAKGNIVFVDVDSSHMFQIDYKIRFISLKDYQITNEDIFYGYICGITASNYDIESIYVDDLLKATEKSLEELEDFFKKLDMLEIKYNVNFIFTISSDVEEIPDYLKKYMLEVLY